MPVLEDYYSILQVHFLAEPEVIESAYRRLAKKYHPDVNQGTGAESRMKKINEAYQTLGDAARRRVYDSERVVYDAARSVRREPAPSAAYEPGPPPGKAAEVPCPAQARQILDDYFGCIKSRDYAGAYALITAMDRKNIALDDFIKWQSGVSRIYSLHGYTLKADKASQSARLGGQVFSQLVCFTVETIEQNSVMGRVEQDTLTKKVVLENGGWRVYVGFEDIRPYITRFEELCALLDAKYAISDMMERYSYKDSGTGLYNRKGFAEAAQREILRYKRYGNPFSVMLVEIALPRSKNQELVRQAAEWAGKNLSDSFRKLDILGRWGDLGFIVLLPETQLSGCIKTARKVRDVFEAKPLVYNKKTCVFKLSIGIDEFRGSLEDTIRNLNNYIDIAARTSSGGIVCMDGIDE